MISFIIMKRLDLSRLQNKFIDIIQAYKNNNKVNQKHIAKLVGIPESHLSNLLKGQRKLSANYLLKFISKDVLKTSDLKDNKFNENEKDFWEIAELIENSSILQLSNEAKKLGLDVEAFLKSYIASSKK